MSDLGIWRTVKCVNELTARHENSFVEVDDKFYLIGGRRIQPVEEFDPEKNVWRQLSLPPVEIHHFHAVAINDRIYIAGAMTGPGPRETPLPNIYEYHPKTDTWTKGAEIPSARRRGSCGTVVRNGKIYLVGGIIDGHHSGLVAWFDCYDPRTGKWEVLPDMPHPRDHAPAIIVEDKLYSVGGRDTSVHTEENYRAFFAATIREVDCYDFANSKWTTLDDLLPIGTAAGGIAHVKNNILYFGGESGQKVAHNETQCLDLSCNKWKIISPLETGRHGSQAIKYKEKIYIASGCGNRGGRPELTSIEVFS